MDAITGFIYYLQNPITGEIFYVGATETSINNRLRTHYQHLREFERGLRKSNRRYQYLLNLKPFKATIHLLELVTDKSKLIEREVFHIQHFRKLNPNLTNMTDGGKGQHTSKYYTEEELEQYSAKISQANKGKSKPIGFAEYLSAIRRGKNNPSAKELNNWIICFKDGVVQKMFKYGFEINQYLRNKHAYGNVLKFVNTTNKPYNHQWKYFKDCEQTIQDIVHSAYENEQQT